MSPSISEVSVALTTCRQPRYKMNAKNVLHHMLNYLSMLSSFGDLDWGMGLTISGSERGTELALIGIGCFVEVHVHDELDSNLVEKREYCGRFF